MKSKKLLIIAGVGATLGVIGYLYFKKKKPTVSETQIKTLNQNTISEIQSELLSPETKPQTVSGSTLGATFSNAQTIVQNENVTTQQSSQVVSQLLDMVQQEKAEALFGELQRNSVKFKDYGNMNFKAVLYGEQINALKRNSAIIKELTNLGYELVGITYQIGFTPSRDDGAWKVTNVGTLKKIGV
jgi:microsomal dipeptidase-like Zn-dependent dipeptidase